VIPWGPFWSLFTTRGSTRGWAFYTSPSQGLDEKYIIIHNDCFTNIEDCGCCGERRRWCGSKRRSTSSSRRSSNSSWRSTPSRPVGGGGASGGLPSLGASSVEDQEHRTRIMTKKSRALTKNSWLPFREDSGKIQGTFREHSGNIRGTFGEHSGNIQRAPGPIKNLISLSGHLSVLGFQRPIWIDTSALDIKLCHLNSERSELCQDSDLSRLWYLLLRRKT
jgi:hypothetical protein